MVEAFINNHKDVYEGEVKETEVINLLSPLEFTLTNRAVDGNYADLTFVKQWRNIIKTKQKQNG